MKKRVTHLIRAGFSIAASAMWLGITVSLALGQSAPKPPSIPISANAHMDKSSVTIGDIVTYTLRITHDTHIQIEKPDPTSHFSGFEFLEFESDTRKSPGGQVIDEYRFRFRAAQVGYYNIPEIPIAFKKPDPGDPTQWLSGRVMAPSTIVEIQSVLYRDGEPTDIREIKPIIGAGPLWGMYLRYALAYALALALLVYIFKRFARPTKRPAVHRTTLVKPHEQALRELEALAARKLIEQGQLREHHFELSEIFRRYIGARYSVPALDWTTEEIMDKLLKQSRFQSHIRNQAATLLHNMDWVKFSKTQGDVKACIHDALAVREFVESTLPAHDIQSSQKSPAAAI